MELQSLKESLLSQALVGTAKADNKVALSLGDLPDITLPNPFKQLQAPTPDGSQDPAVTLFQAVSLVVAYEQSTELPELNSFSIAQIERYGSLYKKIKAAGGQGAAVSMHPKKSDKKDDDVLLYAQVNQHEGPLPLLFSVFERPVFPKAVSSLLKSVKFEPTNTLLYWLLTKLSSIDMQMDDTWNDRLCELYLRPRHDLIEHHRWPWFAQTMLQERIVQVGSPWLWFLLPFSEQLGYEPILPESSGGQFYLDLAALRFDYVSAFTNTNSDVLAREIYKKLRLEKPELSRGLLAATLDNYFYLGQYLDCLRTNLSAEDRPEIWELIQDSMDKLPSLSALFSLYADVPHNPWTVSINELLRQVLIFDGEQWLFDFEPLQALSPDELRNFNVDPEDVWDDRPYFRYKVFRALIGSADWSVLKDMALSGSHDLAIERWLMLPQFLGFTNNTWLGDLGHSIVRAGDKDAAEALLNDEFIVNLCDYVSFDEVLMLLDVDKRVELIRKHTFNVIEIRPCCFVESQDNPLDFKPIADDWAKALLDLKLHPCYRRVDFCDYHIAAFGMYMSLSCIDWLEERIKALQSSEPSALRSAKQLSQQAKAVSKILKILKTRQKVEQALVKL